MTSSRDPMPFTGDMLADHDSGALAGHRRPGAGLNTRPGLLSPAGVHGQVGATWPSAPVFT